MNKAVFFDRDGVINKERGDYTFRIDDFVINEGIFDSMRLLSAKNYLLFIITNQGGISKGVYSMDDVEKLHKHMLSLFVKEAIRIEKIFLCPHHHENESCLCRKPGSLLIEKALAIYNIDPLKSYFIGDRDRDIMAAQNAGVNGIKVESNQDITNICRSL
ncbi:MAG: hypothetical protein A2W91_15580 [Bacteroidetes bacterium GWF2_38_335]|nr:MAG: hypothetical protein A2W91_15580 [Bacteroidetes bacterium GWF2_38_335]OFY81514.1 MAG: hypothetical protein A2281_11440 [Bacteroidetes bacterium RIFOXYA12_FULL_38_20]HBS87683.1 HAD family hydrolase [Bacteroidales bacterium]